MLTGSGSDINKNKKNIDEFVKDQVEGQSFFRNVINKFFATYEIKLFCKLSRITDTRNLN